MEKRDPQEAETAEAKKARYRSIRIAQLTMFIFATGFSIVLTGVYPYMKEVRHFALSQELNEILALLLITLFLFKDFF